MGDKSSRWTGRTLWKNISQYSPSEAENRLYAVCVRKTKWASSKPTVMLETTLTLCYCPSGWASQHCLPKHNEKISQKHCKFGILYLFKSHCQNPTFNISFIWTPAVPSECGPMIFFPVIFIQIAQRMDIFRPKDTQRDFSTQYHCHSTICTMCTLLFDPILLNITHIYACLLSKSTHMHVYNYNL